MSKEIKVGLFFALSLVIFVISIFYVGNFQENLTYQIKFPEVNGLEVDSPVHFNGVPIGRVTRISISEEPAVNNRVDIIVRIGVHRSMRNHIRTSTVADIKSRGVLGDKYILLATNDYSAETLKEDEFIKPIPKLLNVEELLKQGTDLVGDVTDMSENLRKILSQLANQEGLLQRLIGDPELAQTTTRVLVDIMQKIENNESLMGLLLNDPQFKTQFKDLLNRNLTSLAELLESTKGDEGLAAMLLHDAEFKNQVRTQLLAVLDSAQNLVNRYQNAEGLIPRLMEDKEYGDRLAANLERASFHLANILQKMDEGEGSAGLILNDPSIYQGIYEVVYGLNHSGLSKWYIQSKRKKGNKLIEKDK
ncbi:MAG: MCE family protein [Acidobacteria bacterium]|nr:MCE family protein [Acidobacteriota bacterium]MCB9396388.1 MCE family protein [Acidobacteriota bacterium]